jgi:hypothetical protein
MPGPVIRRGSFRLHALGGPYLQLRDWGKGSVWVNDHNLGRHWSIDLQQRCTYIQREVDRYGNPEITIYGRRVQKPPLLYLSTRQTKNDLVYPGKQRPQAIKLIQGQFGLSRYI